MVATTLITTVKIFIQMSSSRRKKSGRIMKSMKTGTMTTLPLERQTKQAMVSGRLSTFTLSI